MAILDSISRRLGLKKKPVIVVSGLPRSGTSMMMKMLEAGGVDPLTDNIRKPDEDNPKGYYEFERVKQLETDSQCLDQAGGKAVKIISMLLFHLPSGHDYKIVFMERRMEEILASQSAMLARMGKTEEGVSDEQISKEFFVHLSKVKSWIEARKNIEVLYVNYNEIFENPESQVDRIARFIGFRLHKGKMAEMIDPGLYRQRK